MPVASPKLLAELDAAIKQQHLESVADVIRGHATECYAIVVDDEDDYSSVGNTRFGGEPDLPRDMPWPTDPEADEPKFSNFIGQLNFAELPALGIETGLPSQGILYLFVRVMESAAKPVVLDTFYYEGSLDELERRETPDVDSLCDEYLTDLNPVKVKAIEGISFSIFKESFRDYVQEHAETIDDEDGETRLINLARGFRRERQIGQILGFANASDLRKNLYRQVVLGRLNQRSLVYCDYWDSMEAYEAIVDGARSNENMLRYYENMREGVAWLIANRDRLSKMTDQLHMLLRLESNSSMNLYINDCDPLYVFARDSDLSERDFSDLSGEVTQS